MKYCALMLFLLACSTSVLRGQTLVLEAENAELTLPAKVKYVSGYSGGAYVGDNDAGSSIVFRNVNIAEEGTYEFRTYYTSMFVRSIAIKSGVYPTVISTGTETTPDWNAPPVAVMTTYIYLNQGNNTIKISPYNGGGPNIDKFEIIPTQVSMPRPDPVINAVAYDLTDDATLVSNMNEGVIDYLNDNDENTVYTFSRGTAEITVECGMPYLISAYFLSSGAENTVNVKNWQLEYSIDGNTYTTLSPSQTVECDNGVFFHISRSPHSDRNKAARYYRLKATGGKIGEIQLFGIPYLTNTDNKNFPADLTQGLDIQTHTLGDPLGVSESFDERYYNLFDRDMSHKYYWHSANSFWVDIELAKPASLDYYTLTSCQDYPERDPKSWVVEGFDTDWETLSEVRNFVFPTRYATMKFYSQNSKTYKGFRLRTLQTNGSNAFQLLKWQVFGKTSSAINQTETNAVNVYSYGNELIVRSDEKGLVRIFNSMGKLVAQRYMDGNEQGFRLGQGFFVVEWSANGQSCMIKGFVKGV